MRSVVVRWRHSVAHVDQTKQAVGHAENAQNRGREENRGDLGVVGENEPLAAGFGEFGSVLKSEGASEGFLAGKKSGKDTRSGLSEWTALESRLRQRAKTKGWNVAGSRGISIVYDRKKNGRKRECHRQE